MRVALRTAVIGVSIATVTFTTTGDPEHPLATVSVYAVVAARGPTVTVRPVPTTTWSDTRFQLYVLGSVPWAIAVSVCVPSPFSSAPAIALGAMHSFTDTVASTDSTVLHAFVTTT